MTSRRFGVIACLVVGLYLLLSPAYAILHYAEYASEGPYLVRYVIVPGLMAAGFLATAIFAGARVAAMVGSCGLSALAALFLFEALLTVRSLPVRMGMLGQLNDEQRELLESAKLVRGFTLRHLNRLSDTKELPRSILSGFPGTQVVLCAPEDELITYTADRYGFNNPDQIYDAPIDLAVLGDSFVEGFCLPRGQDLGSRLRGKGIAAASLGIRGNGPLTEVATLGRFGPVLHPRHVTMLFFAGNDWENLDVERDDEWLDGALTPDADYGTQAKAEPSLQRALAALLEQVDTERVNALDLLTRTSFLRNFVALQQTLTRLGLVYPKISEPIPEFREALRRARALTESWGGTFTLVYVPRVDRYLAPFAPDFPYDQLRKMVLDAASAEEIDVIDLHLALREQKDPASMYAPDGHFSRAGAEFVAEVIADRFGRLRENAKFDGLGHGVVPGYGD